MKKTIYSAFAAVFLGCSIIPAAALSQSEIGSSSPKEENSPLQIWAAGSLKGALTDIARRFSEETGIKTEITFAPAGQLFSNINEAHSPDVYLSADTIHPQILAQRGIATQPVIFTHNSLCYIARSDLGLTPKNALDILLKPSVKIGISTPKNDPAGDYAEIFFQKLTEINSKAGQIIQKKAISVVGGKEKTTMPANITTVPYLLSSHQIDVFIGYCSRHEKAKNAAISVVKIADHLNVLAPYAEVVMLDKKNSAKTALSLRFALYLMSEEAKSILREYNFRP